MRVAKGMFATMTKTVIALLAFALTIGAVSAQNRKEIYELQERCGKRAEQIYEKDFPVGERKGLESFENHYNIRLNRCFILEQNTMITKDAGKSYTIRMLTLVDVNDNKVYGSFSSLNCAVQNVTCRSEQEFRSLIRQFMEDRGEQ
ncbi:hypothetical protein [Bradyrhizobium diazoefficiens]|nr:hypothetical protein [Bradyrhizobium diazoefficiens]QLD43052.1 hypothetical protein HUW42_19560 [Bradyrhizobium diazoefficiens]WLB35331.1 hypothetical protein QIH78_28100 [Bradyrhizobium diazoefficiens]WLC19674.1 hypothetical protein QIH76_15560 [Bradyrhizobium diazoefficiens]BBZ95894.1 hypothetical protein F07S3_57270 [Bradyrhizobium diazoefficiens]BCA13578.1 hypothetical protein BDHF08_54250 [Bradyrhizobium diazoefficiens]